MLWPAASWVTSRNVKAGGTQDLRPSQRKLVAMTTMKQAINKRRWAARKAADVQRQIQSMEPLEMGSSWRQRQRRTIVMTNLQASEARYRRLAAPVPNDSDLPF